MMTCRAAWAALLAAQWAAGATITVCASGCGSDNLSKAIEAAKAGDTIVLKAGEVYRGNFFLPWKEGNAYITIESSRAGELPPIGYRVTPAERNLMATIEQANRGTPAVFAGGSQVDVSGIDAASGRLTSDYNFMRNGEPMTCRTLGKPMPAPLELGKTYYARDADGHGMRLAETSGGPAVRFAASTKEPLYCTQTNTAHHYRFRGIEIRSAAAGPSEYNLVSIGTGAESVRRAVPHDFEFIQVYVHGRPMQQATDDGPRICLLVNASQLVVRDSYIADCKHMGEEGKAIAAWQAPGPLIIQNNYIEGASIGLLLGGAPPAIPDEVIGDGDGAGKGGGVVIRGNHFSKQLAWKFEGGPGQPRAPGGACQENAYALDTAKGQLYECNGGNWAKAPQCADGEYFRRSDVAQNCAAGACWVCGGGAFHQVAAPYRPESYVVKGLLETKSCMNCVISGNVFEKTWGGPIDVPMQVFNPGYNWNRGENILFTDNLIHDTTSGYHNGSEGSARFPHPNRKVRIVNNLFHHIGMTETPSIQAADGRLTMFQGPCIDCSFEHNTLVSEAVGGAGVMFSGRDPLDNFRFDNNIVTAKTYGIVGDGHGTGCEAIEAFAGKSAFKHNVLINNTGELSNRNVGSCAVKTVYVSPKTELFVGEGNYRLKPGGPYSAACTRKCGFAATDGKDVGADIDEVEAETSGAVAGTPTWAEQMKLKVEAKARQAVASYEAADDRACTMKLYTNAARTALAADTAAANRNAGRKREFVLGSAAPLEPGKDYWYLLECRERRIPGHFRTAEK